VAIRSTVRAPTVQERRRAHRLEHVEVVVAGSAVSAQADGNARAEVTGHGRDAARQLHVALGVVRYGDVMRLERGNLRGGDPHAVRREHPRAEESQSLQIGDRGCLAALLRRFRFVRRLGQVDEGRHAMALRQLARRHQRRAVERVHRMRRHGRRDERVLPEFLDQRLRPRQSIGRRLGVGRRELDDRLAEHAAQSGRPRFTGDLLFEVIHVGVGRGAGLDHLERSQPRARAHELGGYGASLRRKDVLLQPLHERQVIGEAAVHHHRRVRVRVDQAGHDDAAPRLDRLAAAELLGDRLGRVHPDDVGAVDGDPSGRQHPGVVVHGDDGAVGDDERDLTRLGLLRAGGRDREQRRDNRGNRALHIRAL
jgi:hypothetical protein